MTHKKMFQFLTLSLFVAMLLFAPLTAQADCQKKGDHEKKMGKECTMKAEGCMMLKQIPNLSEEQKGKLEKLCAEHMKMMAAAKADMEKQALDMKTLMKDPVDVKKIEAKIDEMAKMHADMQKKCLGHCLAVRALLSDEQKAKLGEMGCGMMMHGMGCCKMGGEKKDGKCDKMKHDKCQKAEEEKKTEEKKK
jgi:Spy/CpxP family protein refolding chaperone